MKKLVSLRRVLITLLFVLIPGTGYLLPQDKEVFTLEKALEKALMNNYDVQLSALNLEKSDAQISEAYAGAWPKINLSGQYTRNIKSPVLFIGPNTPFNPTPNTLTFSIGADNSYNLGFSLNQSVYDPRLGTGISIAKKYAEYQKVNDKSTREEVASKVKQAFYSCLLAKKVVDVTKQGYELAKANFENMKILNSKGAVSEFDMLRAEVQVANVEPKLIEAKNNLELALNGLKNLLSIDLSREIDVDGQFLVIAPDPELLAKSDEILAERNPLLRSVSIQKSILEDNIDIEKAAYLPSLSAFGSYAWQTQDNTFEFGNYKWATTFSVGLTLSFQVFDGFKRRARVEQAEIDVRSLDLTRTKLQEGLKISLLQSRLKMDEALMRLKAVEKSTSQAEKAVKIAETRFKNGIGTQLEILDTQNSLTSIRLSYEKAVYDFLMARTEWERVLGLNFN